MNEEQSVAKIKRQQYRENNKEKIKKYMKNYRQIHREEIKQYRLRTRERRKSVNLKRMYGADIDIFNALLLKQNGKCAICQKDLTTANQRTVHLDHCHEDKKIRGLLCVNCNAGLGNFKENPKLLRKAIEYLQENSKIV